MSMDKGIEHGKERRKPYYGCKAIDKSCRNHGSCPYCERGRLISATRRKQAAEEKLKEIEENT